MIVFLDEMSCDHTVRHPRCVFINYNWINQLSNTTIWWLDICCLLHSYQLHVSALMAFFSLIDWRQTCKQLYFGVRFVYGGGGLGLDGGTRSRVCWVGRVMWVHGYYCAGLSLYSLHLWYWMFYICMYTLVYNYKYTVSSYVHIW
jgi:hypothetical protein